MKIKLITIIFMTCILFNFGAAKADDQPKLKSEGLAWALGLDPLPADALFYADKPIQGTINLIIGGIGAGFFYGGIIQSATEDCSSSSSDDWCGFGSSIATRFGAILYFPMIIWDVAGGVSGVRRYNERVREQASIWRSFQPVVSVTSKGGFVGAQFRF